MDILDSLGNEEHAEIIAHSRGGSAMIRIRSYPALGGFIVSLSAVFVLALSESPLLGQEALKSSPFVGPDTFQNCQGVIDQIKLVLNGASNKTTVTEADDGRRINLTVGAQLEARFRQAGGTGFQWVIAKNDSGVLKLKNGYPKFEGDGRPGGAVTEIFLFDVQAPGSTDLVLEFKRPWENLPAERKFSLSIVAIIP